MFLNWNAFDCNIAHRRFAAVLCIYMYAVKFRCIPIHRLYGALPVPFVPLNATRGALVVDPCAHLAAEPRRTRDFYSTLSISLE